MNLRRLSRQIYSLIPLTTREPLHIFYVAKRPIEKNELAMGLEPATC